jgi:hypothetical protein
MHITPITESHHEMLSAMMKSSDYKTFHKIDECLKTFSIFSPDVRASLEKYFLLYWSPQHFKEQLSGVDSSYILKDGIRYYVMYQELLGPDHILAYQQLRLSFRKLPELPFGFVLIRAVRKPLAGEIV